MGGGTGQAATGGPGTLPENGLEDEGQMEEEEEEVCLRESGVGFRTEAAPPIAGSPSLWQWNSTLSSQCSAVG